MSIVDWNNEQDRAINDTGCNILVSAGAGSGKTAVLTERIVRLIEKGNSILDFAVCTFTKKATLEMKERIMKRLLEKELDEQAELAAGASIFTIDAFCKKIVEENFSACDLPSKFAVLENSRILEEQALKTALNELFEDDDFVEFATKISPNDDEKLKDIIKSAYNFCSNIPDYNDMLKSQLEMLSQRDYTKVKEEYARIKAAKLKSIIAEYNDFCNLPYAADAEIATLESDLIIIKDVLNVLEQGQLCVAEQKFQTLKKNMPNKEAVTKLRSKPKNLIKEIIAFNELLCFEPALNDGVNSLNMLIKAIGCFERVFMDIKLKNGVLTFNDLARYAYKILQNESIANEYRNRYKYVLVDEYQDTSRLQQAIIDMIKRRDNLFMVGDIKQSIYSFRNADPGMFFNVYNTYADHGENIRIDLFRNYRSSENIINFVNGVFSVLLNIGKEYYPKNAFLNPRGKYKNYPIEIDAVVNDENDGVNEAEQIANRIEECINNNILPKDIAVLFPSVKTGTPVILYEILRGRGIAAQISDTKDNRFMESRVFLNLISIIDNADNDIPLLSVMYSEIGGFSIDDIIEIKGGKEGSFYSCAKEYKGETGLKKRLDDFFSMIDDFAKDSLNLSVSELMVAVLSRTGYIRMVESRDNGRAKAAQLYGIIKEADNYEAMGYYGLSGFLIYESELEKAGGAGGEDGFVQSGDAVNIMTIHKSKGLEFPVVILGDTGKQIYGGKTDDSVCAFNKDMGIGIDYIDVEKKARINSPLTELIRLKNKESVFEEKMRLLYVAVTRAKERLYIVSRIKSEEKDFWSSLSELQPRDYDSGDFTYTDALIMGLKSKNGCGEYNVNTIEIEKKPAENVKVAVAPEYDEEVNLALNSENDTSVVAVPKKNRRD